MCILLRTEVTVARDADGSFLMSGCACAVAGAVVVVVVVVAAASRSVITAHPSVSRHDFNCRWDCDHLSGEGELQRLVMEMKGESRALSCGLDRLC